MGYGIWDMGSKKYTELIKNLFVENPVQNILILKIIYG